MSTSSIFRSYQGYVSPPFAWGVDPDTDIYDWFITLSENEQKLIKQHPHPNLIERTMAWMNELSVQHDFLTSGDPDELLKSDGTFLWYRYRPFEEEFVPMENDEYGLDRTSMMDIRFWKRMQKTIRYVRQRTGLDVFSADPAEASLPVDTYAWSGEQVEDQLFHPREPEDENPAEHRASIWRTGKILNPCYGAMIPRSFQSFDEHTFAGTGFRVRGSQFKRFFAPLPYNEEAYLWYELQFRPFDERPSGLSARGDTVLHGSLSEGGFNASHIAINTTTSTYSGAAATYESYYSIHWVRLDKAVNRELIALSLRHLTGITQASINIRNREARAPSGTAYQTGGWGGPYNTPPAWLDYQQVDQDAEIHLMFVPYDRSRLPYPNVLAAVISGNRFMTFPELWDKRGHVVGEVIQPTPDSYSGYDLPGVTTTYPNVSLQIDEICEIIPDEPSIMVLMTIPKIQVQPNRGFDYVDPEIYNASAGTTVRRYFQQYGARFYSTSTLSTNEIHTQRQRVSANIETEFPWFKTLDRNLAIWDRYPAGPNTRVSFNPLRVNIVPGHPLTPTFTPPVVELELNDTFEFAIRNTPDPLHIEVVPGQP